MPAQHSKSKSASPLPALLGLAALCCAALPLRAQVSVLTQHNDNARTGANPGETALKPSSVNVAGFGKLATISLDANVNGQVLYVPGVSIQGATRNVIYVYTSNNSDGSPCSIQAFDADDYSPLWQHPLPASARWTTSTPVIDPGANTLYALTKDDNDNGDNKLRAFDITTGDEMPGSPIVIAASVPGTGDGSVDGIVSFPGTGAASMNAHANCRPGLLLVGGVVYAAFAHNSDSFPYHGWIFGYGYDGTQFTQTAVFCTNPNGGEDGVWQSGKGLAADADGNIYCTVGNGTFDANAGGSSYGMCVLKLTPDLSVSDWFAPFDELAQSNRDADTGNIGPLLIPGTNRLFAGATKFGSAFLLDSTGLGGFTPPPGPDQAVQRFDNLSSAVGQNPVCWDASDVKYVYLWGAGANLRQFRYDPNAGQFDPAGIYQQTSGLTNGGSLAVTANGSSDGILWAVGNNGVVHAFDATDVSGPELWNSEMNPGRDRLGSAGHFQFPTIVNGKAYVPTGSATVVVYGLLTPSLPGPFNTGLANTGSGFVSGTNPLDFLVHDAVVSLSDLRVERSGTAVPAP